MQGFYLMQYFKLMFSHIITSFSHLNNKQFLRGESWLPGAKGRRELQVSI